MNLLVSTYEAAVEQNQQLRQAQKELKAQAQILAGINRVFREALTSETEEALGRICLATAEELTGSQFGFIGEINQAGLLEDIAISAPDMAACRMPGLNQPVLPKAWHMRGIFGKAVKDKQSVIANDPPSHPDRAGLPAGHPRGRRQPRRRGHLPSVAKLPSPEKLHDEGPRAHRTDPRQLQELGHLAHLGVVHLFQLFPLLCGQGADLVLHQP